MFPARLILGNKLDISYFIYTTKEKIIQTN